MEQNQSNTAVANDVLHNDHPTKLSAEEIAKALAHHNKRHAVDDQSKDDVTRKAPGKKNR
ncbi:MAG TPA: hypothetical protein VH308_00170 [Terracidiphilus sp.]|jgi:hypothetical protein|nr:hypothetical protein [Terracidiphilus sp.]